MHTNSDFFFGGGGDFSLFLLMSLFAFLAFNLNPLLQLRPQQYVYPDPTYRPREAFKLQFKVSTSFSWQKISFQDWSEVWPVNPLTLFSQSSLQEAWTEYNYKVIIIKLRSCRAIHYFKVVLLTHTNYDFDLYNYRCSTSNVTRTRSYREMLVLIYALVIF